MDNPIGQTFSSLMKRMDDQELAQTISLGKQLEAAMNSGRLDQSQRELALRGQLSLLSRLEQQRLPAVKESSPEMAAMAMDALDALHSLVVTDYALARMKASERSSEPAIA